jgi:hypothetical protein
MRRSLHYVGRRQDGDTYLPDGLVTLSGDRPGKLRAGIFMHPTQAPR